MIPSGIRYLIEGGHQAPSADNSQPWSFAWDGKSLNLFYQSEGPAADVFGEDSHCEKLTMGAVIENIVQLAGSVGMDGTWDLEPTGRRYLCFTPAQPSTAIEGDRQHAVFTRHTNRFRFRPDPILAETVAELEALNEQDCGVAVLSDPTDLAQLADWIRRASAMRFRNRRLHEWFGKTLRFTPAEVDQGNGLDVATIDLPPGGTALLKLIRDWRRMEKLNRLGMFRVLSGIESQAIKKSPALVAILGPSDATLAAGRLMERTWLAAERQHLAVQPYYVLPDQLVRLSDGELPAELVDEGQTLHKDFAVVFGEHTFPHMLFRIGYPKMDVKRSKRLPIESVTNDTSKMG
jgi:hypothetical protein